MTVERLLSYAPQPVCINEESRGLFASVRLDADRETWLLEVPIEVVVRLDPDHPDRARHLHDEVAASLRALGFTLTDEEFGPGDEGGDHHLSDWQRVVSGPSEVAALVAKLRELRLTQFPDGDHWMRGFIPLSTDQAEGLASLGVPVEEDFLPTQVSFEGEGRSTSGRRVGLSKRSPK